ncbi:flagellin [Domibacillus mangrovi]|uniref:Flagellin n=1 Tax=Domibacillus mangrovi TaxID=1714354 RepID=A0A1Q5P2T8_9BACI|nr:flagellin [Domibacillus mangrovi]OKL36432.1 hypothetical protein BLL40_11130 [Domibacillus mangrovi]
MRINHNIQSINTYRQLNLTQASVSKSLEKLSSGLRINQAADDAAGLAISKKMQAQVRGLNQAERNMLDGISLTQTADGGLAGIQDMVQRMRELALQASNGTLTTEDRRAIQKELEQLKKGINEIANNTDFNGIRPLTQEVTTPFLPGANAAMVDIVFFIDYSGSMLGANRLDAVIQGISGFVDGLTKKSLNANIAVVNITTQNPYYKPFSENALVIKNNVETLNTATSLTKPYENINKTVPEGEIGQKLGYRSGSEKIFVLFTDVDNESGSGSEGDTAVLLEGTNDILGYDEDDIQTYVFSFGSLADTAFDQLTDTTGGKLYKSDEISTADDVKNKLQNDLTDDIENNSGGGISSEAQKGILYLQVGANQSDEMEIRLTNATTAGLGIHGVSVDTHEDAQLAIMQLDVAIEKVSMERSKYGAYQNALKYLHTNVTNAAENATSSESRITDANMAFEMTEFTKRNILMQSGQAMFAQSNQLPQGILELLKS